MSLELTAPPVEAPFEARARAEPEGWRAELRLGFARSGEKTILAERRHLGPLQVQRPFHPEGDRFCHVTVLHPPGGVVGGDELTLEVDVAAHAHALITTPAAGKFYRSRGPRALQRQVLRVEPHASLEWFPLENIVYDGARVEIATRVELAPDASFLGWDITCFGRPAAGERFRTGVFAQRFEIFRAGRPLWLEHCAVPGDGEILEAAWGLGGYPVHGSFVCAGSFAEGTAALRERLPAEVGGDRFGVSWLGEVLVARYLGFRTEKARQWFEKIWRILRPELLGRAAVPPRIWKT